MWEDFYFSLYVLLKEASWIPDEKVWIKLDGNVSIQFNTVFENYVAIQKSIKEVKETGLERSQKYRFSGTESNRISLKKKRNKFIYSC